MNELLMLQYGHWFFVGVAIGAGLSLWSAVVWLAKWAARWAWLCRGFWARVWGR